MCDESSSQLNAGAQNDRTPNEAEATFMQESPREGFSATGVDTGTAREGVPADQPGVTTAPRERQTLCSDSGSMPKGSVAKPKQQQVY